MAKKLIALISVIMVCILAFASCSPSIKMDNSGNVQSNGGFVVTTNDYVYFINGLESYETSYQTGKVTTGALLRTKKSNLDKIADKDITTNVDKNEYETVVSKLIVSSDYDAGFYIYGDRAYYAVPSTEKNKKGEVRKSNIIFFSTKLDGTSTSNKLGVVDNVHYASGAKFRFTNLNDTVYLTVFDNNVLYVFNTKTNKKLYQSENKIENIVFDSANQGANIYYTSKIVNKTINGDNPSATAPDYTDLFKVSIGDNKVTETAVLYGRGSATVYAEDEKLENYFCMTGATFKPLKLVDGTLYLSITLLDTTTNATTYATIKEQEITNHKNTFEKIQTLKVTANNATSIFVDTAIYYTLNNKNYVIYNDSNNGIMAYNNEDYAQGTFGRKTIFTSENAKTGTLSFVSGDFLYYYKESTYYRIDLKKALNGDSQEELQINAQNVNTSWYKPEVVTVGEKDYFIALYTDSSYYYNYAYAIDLTALETQVATEKAKDDLEADTDKKTHVSDLYKKEETKEYVAKYNSTLLGVFSDATQKSYKAQYDKLKSEETK